MDNQALKSRRERRKEARVAKQQQRLQSWVHHQALKQQKKKQSGLLNSNQVVPSVDNENLKLDKIIQRCGNFKLESKSSKQLKTGTSTTKPPRTKNRQMEQCKTVVSADEDLASEMCLAKKLKVKEGNSNRCDDAINDLIDEISTFSNSLEVDKYDKKPNIASDYGKKDVALDNKLGMSEKKSKLKGKQPKSVKLQVATARKPKTKFEEYLEMEGHKTVSAQEDLQMEKYLAKKLKVKDGNFGDTDDGFNDLLDGIFSFSDFEKKTEPHDDCIVKDVKQVLRKAKKNKRKSGLSSLGRSTSVGPLEESASPLEFNKDQILAAGESRDVLEEEDIVLVHDTMNEEAISVFVSEQEKLEEPEASVEGIQSEDSENESFETGCLENGSAVSEQGDANAKTKQSLNAVNAFAKYVAPHLRSHSTVQSNESAQIRRRVRGLLNKLSEFNVESIAGEISTIFQSYGRSMGAQIVGDEVLASCSRGPRGNEQYAAVFAAFVGGLAASVGMDFGAKLIASLALSFEDEYRKGDNLALRNLTLLLAYLYVFGLCSSDLIYDFLAFLSKRLEESDVSTILTILQCCGMSLRGDDPAAMKDFVLCIQQQVHDLKMLSAGAPDKKPKIKGKRMEFMLETICEIKNNKRRSKDEPTPHARLKKWLQKLRVEDVQLRGMKWEKLLDPNKKGQWWLSGDMATAVKDSVAEIADVIDAEVAGAHKMLELASAQRMNTEARRAIFCIIMSGEDYLDAFEKILRLNLSGKQDREILRVLVECCLQEKVFNRYYSLLAAKLCHHDKNHKFTLQYCLWDHFKQLNSMELRRLANLARFLADLIGSFALSLAVLKAVDFSDSRVLTSKVVMHFRILFETLFTQYSDAVIWNIFTRIASPPELESLRIGLELFIRQHVNKNPITGTQIGSVESFEIVANRFKVAKKALVNVAGVLM